MHCCSGYDQPLPSPLPLELVVADSIRDRAILGRDVLEANRCTIDAGSRTLRFGKQAFSVALENAAPLPPIKSVNLVLHETLQIPAFSEMYDGLPQKTAISATPCTPIGLPSPPTSPCPVREVKEVTGLLSSSHRAFLKRLTAAPVSSMKRVG